MSLTTMIKDIVGEEIKSLHVAFLAKVLTINGDKAKLQPLGLIKQYGSEAKPQAPISSVHIAQSARYKISYQDGVISAEPLAVGDIVLCICCDRNIDAALKGENALPPVGYHTQSDCVIVSIV